MSEAIYMPNGKPAPYAMTAQQVMELWQVESANPEKTLDYYRGKGLLRGVQLSRSVRFLLPDVVQFMQEQREAVPR